MSMTLNLVDHVLARGRKLQELGRHADALRLFSRLAGWQQLPAEVAEETQARLADIRLRYRQYAQARRHLAAVLAHRPDHARHHYQLARALDSEDQGNTMAALEHYRRSFELDPNQPDCLGDFGLLALRMGKNEEGLCALRRAVELAPDDPAIVSKLLSGLCQCGQPAEGRLVLRAARFRNPRNSAFQKLWDDFCFEQARQAQQAARYNRLAEAETDERSLLPFHRPAPSGERAERDSKRIRRHGISPFPSPHRPHAARLSHQRPA
jgi:tetratricopeptide (TPR) repeat protein